MGGGQRQLLATCFDFPGLVPLVLVLVLLLLVLLLLLLLLPPATSRLMKLFPSIHLLPLFFLTSSSSPAASHSDSVLALGLLPPTPSFFVPRLISQHRR